MNKSQLIDAIAKDAGMTKADTSRVLESLLDTVTKSLKKGEEVAITGFGKFSVVKRAARQGVNPRTGEQGKNQSVQGAEVLGRRRAEAGSPPQKIEPDQHRAAAMALVSELELPAFDYTDPSLRGERFHAAMRELREPGGSRAGRSGTWCSTASPRSSSCAPAPRRSRG